MWSLAGWVAVCVTFYGSSKLHRIKADLARAIEQALIERNPGFENAINSISQRHSYYGSAVDWGEAWLQANGY